MKVTTLIFMFLFSSTLLAEQFVGVEGEGDELDDDYEVEEIEKPASKKAPEDDEMLKRYSDEKEESSSKGDSSGEFRFSAALGASAGSFHSNVTMHYFYTKYLGVDTSVFYRSFDNDSDYEECYGPEVDFVLRIPNPSMVTPYVGIGPGYEKWRRMHNKEVFDDSGSLTFNVMYGVNIALSKNFGIRVANRRKTYIDDPPISFSDRVSHEDRRSEGWGIGFLVMF